MPVIYSNNASTSLSAGINSSVTTIPIASNSGFPTIGTNEYYFATIANTTNTKIEVVKVTAGTTSLTVTRAQGGTSAQAFDSGDNFQLRVTADVLEAATKTDVNITGGAIAGAAITNDVIDSQHYAAASIDNEHLADNAVGTAEIADDAVTAAKLANSINTDIATGVTGNTTANAALPKAGGAMTGAITTNSTFDGVDIATRDGVLTSTTATAAAALPKAGGAMTGAITTNSTFDGRDVATDGTKLDGIEASATADQTAAQIKTALENGIDSVHYVDGSIDTVHIGDLQVTNAKLAANCITADEIGDNVLDSEHYAAGSIDNEHIADDAINSEHYADGSIDTAHLGDLQVTGAKLALDHRSAASTDDVKMGNQHDYIFADASVGLSFFTANGEDMRLLDDGTLHVDGDVIAFSTTISDETLKYDINPIDHALDKINTLKGVTYKYLKDGMESAGLLAQDVEKVLPCAVQERELPLHTGNNKLFKTLNYDNLHALLIESIKELTAKVEKLEKK